MQLSGIGVNTGEEIKVRIRPAPTGTGVRFIRTDLPGKPEIPATPEYATSRLRRTALRKGDPKTGGAEVQLVEHVLAALYAMRVDNVYVEVSGIEMPVGDGSASMYVDAIESAGIVEQDKLRREVVVTEPISITASDSSLIALPSEDGFRVSFTLDYRPAIQPQYSSWKIDPGTFRDEIGPARTFCLEEEIEELRARNLGKGASYQNTLVITRTGQPIENSLRFEDEFCRHKILDILGDLCLTGVDINAHIIGVKSGHALNVRMAEKIRRVVLERVAPQRAAVFDVRDIRKVLPHRYPFLLVDRLIELVDDRRAVGIKNVSVNEEYFQGHWPDEPIMPGVLQVEAMAQVGGLIFARRCLESKKIAVLLSLDNVKFRRTVVPGDQLIIEAETVKLRSRTAHVQVKALVGADIACEADIMYMLVEKPAEPGEKTEQEIERG